ncbi:MAG: abortive phage resistance protein [Microcystis panniformis Mp_MB_F_20051200_S9]|uniref:Abortive phage resistance protein n=1 Tax=Microcystis panniformis Mp_MB_F_20051200_S9 TaxID=2486223 RepID=A0A552PVX5_9CHRO|nr:MAG: abortive phage resistance protein [Microcystis panniformis Mp_GB_SS_20050300_S99]TRV52826.1 MAG: abortive phage resistance protein [Microcystis panniformis Mp_MB_F_20080800_S26D]TRV52894.1 MAG: abortive phage resistance protein [Microcystis panniformis Mp_GB_SS_20050300_S99D]TRV55371.1 MAG: abortive phage resistance protein [Microcystis panniformis Mp_MB_F_20080800_S26]TRV56344.1 MAG: abortive phage resistance protein [Microcystis panniformis Mp_MB_F_20051200_S9D]TRV61111.1 MAG: aborti
MNINISIIDQRLVSVSEDIRQKASEELRITEAGRLKSLAFVYLCVKTILDLDGDDVFDCLTEGGGDFGVDAIHISEEYDGEFTVSLFQAKYKHNLEGNSNFPEEGIKSLINAINYLFNPAAKLEHINQRLLVKVEEARSLIRDGYIPQVRTIACNNGLKWNLSAQEAIDRAEFGDQVTWEYVNHERLVKILQASKPVKDTLQLSGKAIVEDMEFSRVLLGRISVTEIATLIDRHGERLLERNIRRYLGLQGNRVNEGIRHTLTSDEKNNFYFYNNGVTLTCDSFSYNALQDGDYKVRVENLQIINGGQTCMTIFKTLREPDLIHQNAQAFVLLRLYQLPRENEGLVQRITYATNSQNPVDLKDLRANDERQKRLEMDIQQLGFNYRPKRSNTATRSTDITSGVAAEAVLSVWRRKPHQAKFFSREHFGKLYDTIFTDQLNGAQIVIAVQLYRIAENRRKRPDSTDPDFVRYASCFIAMQMGQKLLNDMKVQMKDISHQNFQLAQMLIDQNGESYFNASLEDIQRALQELYGEQEISLQQLSATFRRGDLISKLQ